MEIYKIEDTTIDLKREINALDFISNIFSDDLEEELYRALNEEDKDLFNKLCSYNIIIKFITKDIKNLANKYNTFIENFYANN